MSNLQNLIGLWASQNKGLIHRALDSTIYIDNPAVNINAVDYSYPVMDSKAWCNGIKSKSASTDPLALVEVFPNPFGDLANDMLTEIKHAKDNNDRSRAAAVITSQDYAILQDAIPLGESVDAVKTGILTGLVPEIPLANFKGEWFNWDDAVEFHLNVPEGKAVEPSKGSVSSVEYTIPKHMGGVAITEYAQAMINAPQGTGTSIFNRLVQAMGRQRLKKENGLVATEIENTTNTIAGIDFGARASNISSNNPEALFTTFADLFDSSGGSPDLIMSKNQVYNEAINNDFLKGHETPNNIPGTNESIAPAPGLQGVRWARDNAISSATKLWIMDQDFAMKGFRVGVRSFQITNPKHENTEYYLKSFYIPKIVDQDFIREVTGVTA